MPPALEATLRRLRSQGHAVHVLKTSDGDWDADLAGIPTTSLGLTMRALEEATR